MKTTLKRLSLAIASVGMLAVYGCGGSSSSTSSLTLSGVAATGDAISGGAVLATCASGSGSGTTQPDGTYTFTITNATMPCLAKVTSSDGLTILHTVVQGSGTSAVANITPLTELVVASLSGTDPKTYYASFGSTTATAITADTVATAQTAVLSTLTDAGVDISSVGNLITGTLTPKTGSQACGYKYPTGRTRHLRCSKLTGGGGGRDNGHDTKHRKRRVIALRPSAQSSGDKLHCLAQHQLPIRQTRRNNQSVSQEYF